MGCNENMCLFCAGYIEIHYMMQLLMVLIMFTDGIRYYKVLETCMHKVFALYTCVVSSWCGRPESISWGGTETRWRSAHYTGVSEVQCSSQNAKIYQCIEWCALGWLINLSPFLWSLDHPCMHSFFLILFSFHFPALLWHSCPLLPLSLCSMVI